MDQVQKLSPSTAIVHETRVEKANKTSPVKLRVTFNRKQKYYSIKYFAKQRKGVLSEHQKYWIDHCKGTISLTKEEYHKVRSSKSREPYKTMFTFLNEIESIARDAASTLPVFSFQLFEEKFYEKPIKNRDLLSDLNTTVEKLKEESRISTARTYECAKKSLEAYTGKEIFSYDKVTESFLAKYENWMLKKGNSLTTVGIYLRNVRAVFRRAMKEGIIQEDRYPFGENKYQIPTGKNIKKALTQSEVGLIANYKPIDGSSEHRNRDYWLLSYLCNGINVKDMARLKYRDVDGDIIKLIRAKTERESRKKPRPITIVITRQIGKIIDRWGNKPGLPDQYILPILEEGMTAEKEYKAIQQATKLINHYIKEISISLKIPQKVTTYTARHSIATVLKRFGASVEFISESLGHSNQSTTENYLADFEIEEKRKWAEKVADF